MFIYLYIYLFIHLFIYLLVLIYIYCYLNFIQSKISFRVIQSKQTSANRWKGHHEDTKSKSKMSILTFLFFSRIHSRMYGHIIITTEKKQQKKIKQHCKEEQTDKQGQRKKTRNRTSTQY